LSYVEVHKFEYVKEEICFVIDAENPMNRTTASVQLHVDERESFQLNRTVTCASLKYCHNRGQCLVIEKQLKCL